MGISAENMETVLKPFHQVDSSLSRQHAGTGLGLPLVKAFVEAHGGLFDLRSIVGRETTALVTLPVKAPVYAEANDSLRAAG